ncbi:hypothetical protein [Oceanibaculum nanhaiense]|uniref:hypothetical protein n=1 Tax=Oceanibaculum nanhaiense TaxID=1909734 RepID=UPI003D2E2EE4
MGTDQGRTSNVNALAILSATLGAGYPGGRHHHLPPALHAGRLRRHRRAQHRQAVRPGAPHANP